MFYLNLSIIGIKNDFEQALIKLILSYLFEKGHTELCNAMNRDESGYISYFPFFVN